MTEPTDESAIDALLAASSLGGDGLDDLCARTPPHALAEIRHRAQFRAVCLESTDSWPALVATHHDVAPVRTGVRRRWSSLIAAASLALCTVTSGYAALAWHGTARSGSAPDTTAADRLVLAADSIRRENSGLARRLAVAAFQIAPTDATDDAVRVLIGPARVNRSLDSSGSFTTLALSPDGRTLAAGGTDGTLILWDTVDPGHPRRLGRSLTEHSYAAAASPHAVTTLAFSPNGRVLAVGRADRTARLWNITDRVDPNPLELSPAPGSDSVTAFAFSRDGHTLATGGPGGDVTLWTITDPARPAVLSRQLTGNGLAVTALAFSTDGATLAVGEGNGTTSRIVLADLGPGQLTADGEPISLDSGSITALTFNSRRRILAVGDSHGQTMLWDVTDRSDFRPWQQLLGGHTYDRASASAFSADGRYFAVSGADDTVTVSDLDDPTRPIRLGQPLRVGAGSATAITFSARGDLLATGGEMLATQLWSLDPAVIVRAACAEPANRISVAEWARYVPELPYRPPCP